MKSSNKDLLDRQPGRVPFQWPCGSSSLQCSTTTRYRRAMEAGIHLYKDENPVQHCSKQCILTSCRLLWDALNVRLCERAPVSDSCATLLSNIPSCHRLSMTRNVKQHPLCRKRDSRGREGKKDAKGEGKAKVRPNSRSWSREADSETACAAFSSSTDLHGLAFLLIPLISTDYILHAAFLMLFKYPSV